MIHQYDHMSAGLSACLKRRFFISLLMLLMIAGAHGSVAAQEQAAFEVDPLNVGDKAPTFVMKKNGTTDYVFLRDYAGELRQPAVFRGATQQVVILSFFASWCKPCQKEAPVLAEIARGYEGRDVQLFFVNWGDSDREAAAWLASYGVEANCLMDPFGANAKKFGVNTLPRTIIIDKQGYVQLIERGFSEENEAHYREVVTTKVNELLNPPI
ncbi:TlpA family protein disulfide reductase [Gemmatimonadota bacterium]